MFSKIFHVTLLSHDLLNYNMSFLVFTNFLVFFFFLFSLEISTKFSSSLIHSSFWTKSFLYCAITPKLPPFHSLSAIPSDIKIKSFVLFCCLLMKFPVIFPDYIKLIYSSYFFYSPSHNSILSKSHQQSSAYRSSCINIFFRVRAVSARFGSNFSLTHQLSYFGFLCVFVDSFGALIVKIRMSQVQSIWIHNDVIHSNFHKNNFSHELFYHFFKFYQHKQNFYVLSPSNCTVMNHQRRCRQSPLVLDSFKGQQKSSPHKERLRGMELLYGVRFPCEHKKYIFLWPTILGSKLSYNDSKITEEFSQICANQRLVKRLLAKNRCQK